MAVLNESPAPLTWGGNKPIRKFGNEMEKIINLVNQTIDLLDKDEWSLLWGRPCVYVLEIEGGIYIGSTTRLLHRMLEHMAGMTSNKTSIVPKRLLSVEFFDTTTEARKAEYIKMKSMNPTQGQVRPRKWGKI
jgi:predicted GIY-YIG superfamily endonuclease